MGALGESLGVKNLEGAQESAQGTGEGSERVGGFGRGRSGRRTGALLLRGRDRFRTGGRGGLPAAQGKRLAREPFGGQGVLAF